MTAQPIDLIPPDDFFTDGEQGDAREPYSAWREGAHDADDAPIALLDGCALAEPLPPLEYLVREMGLVAGGGAPHLVAGYGFSGKTLALQALLLALAARKPVWGAYHVADARRVLHVDLEQGRRLTQRRYQRLARSMGVDLASLGDALAVAVMPPLALTSACEPQWRQILTGRHLALVDSLRAASGGQDENSSEIRAGLDMLGHASEATGCRVTVIHHARKPNDDAPAGRYAIRGSSAIFDGCDGAYLFTASKGEPVLVEHVKARSHGELLDDFALVIADQAHDGEARAGLSVTVRGAELVSELREAAKKAATKAQASRDAAEVRKLLASSPGLGSEELREHAGLNGTRYRAVLHELGHALDVRNEPNGKRAHYLRATP